MTMPNPQELREEFEQWRIKNAGMYKADDIANFFYSKFDDYKKDLRDKIAGMRKRVKMEGGVYKPLDVDPACIYGYNQAIIDILKLL